MFVATGISLGLIGHEKTTSFAQSIAMGALLAVLLMLLGYLSSDTFLYELLPEREMAIWTAATLAFLAMGTLFMRAAEGITVPMIGRTPSASNARRLLALTLTAPLILGIASIIGAELGLYDAHTGISFLI